MGPSIVRSLGAAALARMPPASNSANLASKWFHFSEACVVLLSTSPLREQMEWVGRTLEGIRIFFKKKNPHLNWEGVLK